MSAESSSSRNELKRVESLSISPEFFEKLYLSPENAVKEDWRKTLNPTPVFVFSLPPFSKYKLIPGQSTRRLRRGSFTHIN
jgi:hypothetical protein